MNEEKQFRQSKPVLTANEESAHFSDGTYVHYVNVPINDILKKTPCILAADEEYGLVTLFLDNDNTYSRLVKW